MLGLLYGYVFVSQPGVYRSNSGNQEAQDVITYSFQAAKMKMEYKPQQTKGGTLGGANEATWDVKKNTP